MPPQAGPGGFAPSVGYFQLPLQGGDWKGGITEQDRITFTVISKLLEIVYSVHFNPPIHSKDMSNTNTST